MLLIISPAKSMDEQTPSKAQADGLPFFLEKASRVNAVLRTLQPDALEKLQSISTDLAQVNYQRNQDWCVEAHHWVTKPAIDIFSGDVYQGLDTPSWTSENYEYAQNHLRILSGMYGLLRPLDKMMPYRLEMGTRLKIGAAANLYTFWKAEVTREINALETSSNLLLDLSSQEYGKVVNGATLEKKRIEVVFKDSKNGQYKIISFFAKKARGLLASWVIRHKINSINDLIQFDENGYYYVPKASDDKTLVFHREA
jgi:cytoplasmic iron level regulating protein YaaA (DUF328/UPF0246 family)